MECPNVHTGVTKNDLMYTSSEFSSMGVTFIESSNKRSTCLMLTNMFAKQGMDRYIASYVPKCRCFFFGGWGVVS